jgi:glucose/arabinose dehydrogenase
VLRGINSAGSAEHIEVFAQGLVRPYGIAFYPPGADPQWLYVGDSDAVVRFAYHKGDLRAAGSPQPVAVLPQGGGHWTRDLRFASDGRTLFVAVGSASNVDDPDTSPQESERADILAFDPDGSHRRIYARGLRNPSGLAIDPATGALWCAVNERDGLGDDLVPDYVTHVQRDGFYGWPWWYLGAHQDPRHAGKHPELAAAAIVPDVLLQAHGAPLQITFYQGQQFPAEYRGHLFATEHGSWNRSMRTGYKVIRVPIDTSGRAGGAYQDFLTGFVLNDQQVWGRPVGIAEAADGSLLVSDDASNSIWRVRYPGP